MDDIADFYNMYRMTFQVPVPNYLMPQCICDPLLSWFGFGSVNIIMDPNPTSIFQLAMPIRICIYPYKFGSCVP